ncbi:MAG: hypothetical protein COA74_08960 [Gammaproteobacteria bacterium]|nr:MAG: hypothetical protein COA74_08960 [Gammaproteobacteria bacterium]
MIRFPTTLSKQQFLDQYWQKKPLLFRKALANAEQFISKEQLFKLSVNDQVESRLLLEDGPEHSWQTFHGPQQSSQLQSLEHSTNWTLLVQSVNLWLDNCSDLLKAFDFIPQWRLDDIMVSFATKNGSVGPHLDQYDVFLIQLTGKRRWMAAEANAAVEENTQVTTIKQVKPFKAIVDDVLEAGDMLYVPPNTAHHGVNLEDGMTLSIGFRSPALSEALMLFAEQLMLAGNESFYKDAPLTEDAHSAEISSAAMTKASNWINDLDDFSELKRKTFGLLQTQPKQELIYVAPNEELSSFFSKPFHLDRDPSSRVAWYQVDENSIWLFINGELFERTSAEKDWITLLSSVNSLSSGNITQQLSEDKFIILLEIFVETGLFGIK